MSKTFFSIGKEFEWKATERSRWYIWRKSWKFFMLKIAYCSFFYLFYGKHPSKGQKRGKEAFHNSVVRGSNAKEPVNSNFCV
jgi:hypothetical protein